MIAEKRVVIQDYKSLFLECFEANIYEEASKYHIFAIIFYILFYAFCLKLSYGIFLTMRSLRGHNFVDDSGNYKSKNCVWVSILITIISFILHVFLTYNYTNIRMKLIQVPWQIA